MLRLQTLLQVGALTVSAGALLLANPASTLAAQDNPPCPFTNDSVVSAALGSPVHGYADPGTPPGFDVCEFGDFTIYRQSGADVTPGLAAQYVKKTECFCFTQQTLGAHEAKIMPLLFHIDKSIPADLNTLTLSYTLFSARKKI